MVLISGNGSISRLFSSNWLTEFKKEEKIFQIYRLCLSTAASRFIKYFHSNSGLFFFVLVGSSGIGRIVMVMYSNDQHFSQSFQIFFWETLCMFHSMYINSKWVRTKYSSLTEVNLCKYFTQNIIWCKNISLVNTKYYCKPSTLYILWSSYEMIEKSL